MQQIDNTIVGFGDSRTIIDMKLYDLLASHNTVYDPNQSVDNDGFLEIARKTLLTDVYLTSVNGASEAGKLSQNRDILYIGSVCLVCLNDYVLP